MLNAEKGARFVPAMIAIGGPLEGGFWRALGLSESCLGLGGGLYGHLHTLTQEGPGSLTFLCLIISSLSTL